MSTAKDSFDNTNPPERLEYIVYAVGVDQYEVFARDPFARPNCMERQAMGALIAEREKNHPDRTYATPPAPGSFNYRSVAYADNNAHAIRKAVESGLIYEPAEIVLARNKPIFEHEKTMVEVDEATLLMEIFEEDRAFRKAAPPPKGLRH
jgi:hypothetical protein